MNIEKMAAVLLGISLFAASSGATSAYLTARPEEEKNVITAGNVTIRLTEPEWSADAAKGLAPKSVVPKNPMVTNTGSTDAWIFLRVSVPIRTIRVVNSQTRRAGGAEKTELFSFTANENWEQLSRTESGEYVQYVYGCRSIVPNGGQTAPLFEQVKLVNFLEGELTRADQLEMPVEAAAIQDKVCPPGAQLSDIYEVYVKEEAGYGN